MDSDTSTAQRARYHELLRARSPHERLHIAATLSGAVRKLVVAGLRLRHPDASEEELRVRLTVRLYGRALAARVFHRIPGDAV